MKTFALITILAVSIPLGMQPNIKAENLNYFPQFMLSYPKIRHWEGNYAFLEYDKGGETYAGIARNFNKDWEGWEVLDEHKSENGVHWNKKIEEVETLVIQYYYKVWMDEGFYRINDEFIRTYLFDYRNSGTIAYRHMKEVLRYHGYDVGTAAVLDDKSIQALNKINSLIFILHLKEVRMEYYTRVAVENPELEMYLKGWIRRAKHITS